MFEKITETLKPKSLFRLRIPGRERHERKRRSKRAVLPPETLLFLGDRKLDEPKVTLFSYNTDTFSIEEIPSPDTLASEFPKDVVTWLNIEGLHDTELISRVGEIFGLHPLLLEDILDFDLRPKIEVYDDKMFFVIKMLSVDNQSRQIVQEQISFVLGDNFLITFQEGVLGDVFERVRERITKSKGKIRRMKSDYLFYELLDSIIDNYFLVMEQIGDKLDLLEKEILLHPAKKVLIRVHSFKTELLSIRKLIWPMRDMISKLERDEDEFIDEQNRIYIRDIYDHIFQAIETIEIYRDTLSNLQDLYHSSLSNKMNEVMKVLTIITTIFIPLSFIAGVYGMNFENMPELQWEYGYFVVLGLMVIISLFMLYIFKRKKWLK